MLDIKLKNYSRVWYVKLAAFIIMIACTAGFIGTFWYGVRYKDLDKAQFGVTGNYADSSDLTEEMRQYLWDMLALQYRYVDEENIQAGKAIGKDEVLNRFNTCYDRWVSANGDLEFGNYGNDSNYGNYYYENGDPADDGMETEERDLSYEEFEKRFPDLKESISQGQIQDQLSDYNRIKQQWDPQNHFQFTYQMKFNVSGIEDRKRVLEQSPIYFAAYAKATYSNNDALTSYYYDWKESNQEFMDLKDSFFAITVSQSYMEQQQEEQNRINADAQSMLVSMAVLFVAAIAMFVYLAVATGRKADSNELHLTWIDRIWSELQAGIGGLVILTFSFTIGDTLLYHYDRYGNLYEKQGEPDLFLFYCVLVGTALAGTVLASLLLSQIRRLKGRKFLSGFILIRLVQKLFRGFMTIWHGGKLMNRAALLAILIPILSATWIGTPFMIGLLLFLAYRYVNDFNQLSEGVKKVKGGELSYSIEIAHNGDIKELAEDINTLSNGLNNAISAELRSERLKSELISNVSHDLKTPLTSIITYVDLLQKEKIENEAAKDYIEVIDRKAQRLKVLTTDLFEAAKASSGDMPVNLERMDLNALIRQGLGEFNDKLLACHLDIRAGLPEHSTYINADGRLMWRVLENMLSNVVKYASHGTRVYLDVTEHNETNTIEFTMKNISDRELNIAVEDLMERFTRGDDSRNTEGSGLGLSIARSLVNLQHGQFLLSIDGDLFKVTVVMPAYLVE